MSNLNAALSYAERGWRVLPIEPGTKEPLKWLARNGWKHGAKDATTEEDTITKWWTANPEAGIGIATGKESGIWCVDADGQEGIDNWERICRVGGIAISPLYQFTGGGGRQYIYLWPESYTVRNGVHKLGPRIDIRGQGGYFCAPPTVHPSGRPYQWGDEDAEPLETPQRLIDAIRGSLRAVPGSNRTDGPLDLTNVLDPAEYARKDEAKEALAASLRNRAREMSVQSKERHPQLVWYAAQLRDAHLEYERARLHMSELCRELKTCHWSPRLVTCQEGEKVLASAYGRPPREQHPFLDAVDDYLDPDRERPVGKVNKTSPLRWKLGHALNDLGNARRFSEMLKDVCLYVPTYGWMHYRHGRWNEDPSDLQAQLGAQEVFDELHKEMARVVEAADKDEAEEIQKAWRKHISRTGNANSQSGLVRVARSVAGMNEREDVFDYQPHILNCANGTLDLRTGRLRPHNPADRLSKRTEASYVPESPRPLWEKFLREIFAGQEGVVEYVQRVLGYCLTGETIERQFWMLSGVGANGKDTLMGTVASVMGSYADRINSDIFLQSAQNNGNAATPEKAKLKGLRLVLASETPEDGKLNENEIKQITGGDDITARRLHCPPMTFRPTHKIIILTNYKPHTSNDTAVWDRMKLIEFRERFDGERRDPRLKETLKEEADGILAWLVEGAMQFYRSNGVGHIPTSVRNATEEYRSSENIIDSWMKERTRSDQSARHTAKELYEDFKLWMSAETEKTISQQKFGRQLSRLGIQEVKSNGIRFRQGLALVFQPELKPGWAE